MKLITYGKHAFNEIILDIDQAQKHIFIQMFIWRDDSIGNRLLNHLNQALERGVLVTIQKDAYGSIFEKAEENKQSLFHKEKQKGIHFLTKIIDWGYADFRKPRGYTQQHNPQLASFLNHPNLTISTIVLKDHTKFYVIDDTILYIGGVNIEDKENGKDIQGRTYLDYMVRIDSKIEVDYFLSRFNQQVPYDPARKIDYIMNRKLDYKVDHDLTHVLQQVEKRIILHMAYFGAKNAMEAIQTALSRGIEVVIVTSRVSNLQTEYNLYWMNKLQNQGAKVYLYEGLVHAKALLVDDTLIVGSTNLNNAAYYKLGECSLVVQDDSTMIQSFLQSHAEIIQNSSVVRPIKYRKIQALFERLLS